MRFIRFLKTPLLRAAAAMLLPLATAACGGGGPDMPLDPQPPNLVADLYVDAVNGSDAGTGSPLLPFKTLTYAMTQATSGMKVKVMPGFYDAGNGESFPIQVPSGVQLLGDEDAKGKGSTPTMIIGGGPVSSLLEPDARTVILPGQGTVIAGFIIQNTFADPVTKESGLLLASSQVAIRNNTIQFNDNAGIRYLNGGIDGRVFGNVIKDNGMGLFFKAGGWLVRVEGNSITKNNTGVMVWAADIDLGGGIAGSAGNNLIAWNTSADLTIMNPVHVMAQDNRWNHVPPTLYAGQDLSLVPPGVDVWRVWGNGTVDTTGAKLPQIFIGPNIPVIPLGP